MRASLQEIQVDGMGSVGQHGAHWCALVQCIGPFFLENQGIPAPSPFPEAASVNSEIPRRARTTALFADSKAPGLGSAKNAVLYGCNRISRGKEMPRHVKT